MKRSRVFTMPAMIRENVENGAGASTMEAITPKT